MAAGSLPFTAVLFVLWGLVAFAAAIPVQHRLVSVDPPTSALALSWYSTAMYLGIAIAPVIGSAALTRGGPQALPVAGAVVSALAVVIFVLGYGLRRRISALGGARTEAGSEEVRGQQRRHGHEEHAQEDVEPLHL